MKKIYINPETQVVKIQISQILEASPVEMIGKDAEGEGMSRGGFWDDDEEEY